MKDNVMGVYPAKVTKTDDPEKRGRIKVKCPDIYGNHSVKSPWCEPCSFGAYDNGGDFVVPKKDEGVWITFIDGDIDRPVYLGGWWAKKETPVGDNYTDVTEKKVVKYEDNTIMLEKGSCTIKTKDVTITIKNGKVKIKGDVEIDGDLKAKNIEATEGLKVGSIVFAKHTHTGVHGETSTPH